MEQTLTIFSNSGKHYIGYLCEFGDADEKPSFVGINQDISDDVWIIKAPCELKFKIEKKQDGTSGIDFDYIMPIMPGPLYNGNAENVYFLFHKATTSLSTIKSALIASKITTAYKQLTGVA